MKTVLSMALALSITAPAIAADVKSAFKDLGGVWQLDFTAPDEVHRTPFVLVGRQYDELVAWYVDNDKSEKFKTVSLKDETLSLSFRPEETGGEVMVTFKAKLSGEDKCAGEAEYEMNSGESGSFDFTGKRIPPSFYDEVSQWTLSFTTPDGEDHTAKVVAVSKSGKQYAWFSGKDHDIPAKSISVEDNKVVLSLTVETADGGKVDVTFRGTEDDGRVTGDAEYDLDGETGSFPFTAKQDS